MTKLQKKQIHTYAYKIAQEERQGMKLMYLELLTGILLECKDVE